MARESTLVDCLHTHATEHPQRDAIVTTTHRLSYLKLEQLVSQQALRLADIGVDSTSVVGIHNSDDVQHLILCLAAMQRGATSCTIPSYESQAQQTAVRHRCEVTHVVDETLNIDLSTINNTPNDRQQPPLQDATLLFSTSGTTGTPKRVIHHSADIVHQAPRHIECADIRFACIAGIEHNFAKRHRLYCVAMGATNVILGSHLDAIATQCHELNATVLHLSAFQAQELLAAKELQLLRRIRLKLGGSHVPTALRQRLRESISDTLCAGYGTTETGAISFTDPTDTGSSESVGRPLPGIEVAIRDSDNKVINDHTVGQICIRCSGMFRGYQGLAEKTAERLVDGWFLTGDMGLVDQQGRIHLRGRADDMFVFNSMNIFPQQLEASLVAHPAVNDAAVFPIESNQHGGIPAALIVLDSSLSASLDEIQSFANKNIGLRAPRQFLTVDKIPRNPTGKIDRDRAIEWLNQQADARGIIVRTLERQESLEPSMRQSLARFAKAEVDIEIGALHLDSLSRMELLIAIETQYHTVITPQQFQQCSTLSELLRLCETQRGRTPPHSATTEAKTPLRRKSQTLPPAAKLFDRVFRICRTVSQLYKALESFEHRLTPSDFCTLKALFDTGQLIEKSTEQKFHQALAAWFAKQQEFIDKAGKQEIEPFSFQRLSPAVVLFNGSGAPEDKELLVCFSTKNSRRLMIPHTALLQHIDASKFNVLVISDPQNTAFRGGVVGLGPNVPAVANWLTSHDVIARHKGIRCFGVSAGSYPALIAGYSLNAARTVCVGGRFPAERHVMHILKIIFNIWRASRRSKCKVILTYGADRSRDRTFAKLVAWLTPTSRLQVAIPSEQAGHRVIEQLLDQAELVNFLSDTLFASRSDPLLSDTEVSLSRSYPNANGKP